MGTHQSTPHLLYVYVARFTRFGVNRSEVFPLPLPVSLKVPDTLSFSPHPTPDPGAFVLLLVSRPLRLGP